MKTWHTDGPFNPLGNGLRTLVRLVFGLGHIAGRLARLFPAVDPDSRDGNAPIVATDPT